MNTIDKIIDLFDKEKAEGKSRRSVLLSIGLREDDFQQWKSGRNVPTYEKLVKLARYFNVTTDYLLGLTDESPSATLTANSQIMPNGWDRLTLEQREDIMSVIEVRMSALLGESLSTKANKKATT